MVELYRPPGLFHPGSLRLPEASGIGLQAQKEMPIRILNPET